MKNEEKLKIIQYVSDLVRSRSLLTIPGTDTGFEYLQNMLENRLVVLKPTEPENYIWPFYLEHTDFIQFVFPSPPFDEDHVKIKKIAKIFIQETRNCINEIIDKKPKKIVLDLRNNVGGFIYVFYDALLPLLPHIEGQKVMFGIDKNGCEVMNFSQMNGKMLLVTNNVNLEGHKLSPVQKRPSCEIEIWVNSRSASSSEFVMILCGQEGYNIVGGPTLGLTTGMTSFDLDGGTASLPTYMFKDKNGKIYQPVDSKIEIKDGKEQKSILARNVLVDLPADVVDKYEKSPSIPTLNNIISEYFDNNYHCSIHHETPKIYYNMFGKNEQKAVRGAASPQGLYIYVPHKCTEKISTILDIYKDQVLAGMPVLIDIRGSKFGADKEDFMELFEDLYKPWKVQLLETTHSQDDDFDRKFDKLEKKNLEGEYAYVSNMRPFTFAVPRKEIGRYSSINAKFWVNKFTIFGNISSCILLLYLKHNFGLKDEHKLPRHYNYSMHKYIEKNIEVYVYSNKFQA